MPMNRLPDGRLIDSKNTLQSFDDVAVQPGQQQQQRHNDVARMAITSSRKDPPTATAPEPDPRNIQNNNGSSENHVTNQENDWVYAQATAVNTIIVAEEGGILAPSGPIASPTPPTENYYIPNKITTETLPAVTTGVNQNNNVAWCLLAGLGIIVVGVVAGIGGYCGSGNCGGGGGADSGGLISSPPTTTTTSGVPPPAVVTPISPMVTNLPTQNPITDSPTTNPSMSPSTTRQQQLTIACNFLNHDSISECQSDTNFASETIGSIIPTEMGLLTQLTSLNLFSEQLTGTIPTELGYLTRLTSLNLWTNGLTGTIPSSLGFLTRLTLLYLDTNELLGTIPSSLGSLTNLRFLGLSENPQLIGTVPSSLCSVFGIEIYIDCDNTNIVCACCSNYSPGNVTPCT